MFWYEQDVIATIARRDAWQGDPAPLLLYGSSSLRLWADCQTDLAPWPVMNLGFGGSTIAACAWFFDRVIVPTPSRALVLYAGDNDLGDGRHPQEVINNFQLLALRWRELRPDQPIFFMAVKPSPARRNLLSAVHFTNTEIRAWCAQREGCHFIDVSTPLLRDGEPSREFFEADGLHMNRKGYAQWAPRLKEAWAEVLAPIPVPANST